jgi:cell division protease FtsH
VSRNQDYSEATAQKIDSEVNRLLREAYQHAIDILKTNRDKLDLVARMLIERETLDGREVVELVRHGRFLSPDEREKSAPPPPPAPAVQSASAGPEAAKETPPVIGTPAPKPSPA